MNSPTDDLQELVKAAPFIDIYLDADSPLPEGSKIDDKAESKAGAATKAETETEVSQRASAGSAAEVKQTLVETLAATEDPFAEAHPVSPLSIGNTGSAGFAGTGSHSDKLPADLYPALLRAHIALARVVEASRSLVLADAPARFLLLKAAHADRVLCHEPGDGFVELPGFLLSAELAADSANNQHGSVEQSASLLEQISSRVRETGINKQLLTELSLLSGNRQLLREGALTQDSGIFASEYAGADAGTLNVLIENWLEYVELSARNTDALIVNAIAYHQFLSMSPFETSNSPAALAVLQMLLIDSGVTSLPVLALGESVHENFEVHYSLFRKLNEQRSDENLHRWLEHCIELITVSATHTLTRIHGCRAQASHIRKVVAQTLSATHSDAVSRLLIEQPVTRIRDFVDRGIAKRQTASVYLKKLCDAGVLKEQQSGKEKLFLNNNYLQIFNWDSGQ